MAEQNQIIVTPNIAGNNKFGSRKEQNIRASFPESPIFKGEITDEERKQYYNDNVLSGEIIGGKGINKYNLDYKGTTQNPVPNLEDVQTGGGGLPASPYMPNPTSPGPGSVSAADQAEYLGEIRDPDFINNWGSGLGGLVSPSQSSGEIAKQTLGNYILGKSYNGSNGKVS